MTYDRKADRWLTAKLDMLPWPGYVYHSEKRWINPEGFRSIKKYLGVSHGGYQGILEYQLKVRAEELKQRHKRETNPWDMDMDMEQIPELPKDWDRWVSKVGIRENYIFYHYDRRGVKEGYCTYCEKEVPINHPKHNKQGTCPRCRHKITFKSKGRAAEAVVTDEDYMYLIQRCEDGFMIREFIGKRIYRRPEGYRNAECRSQEIRRVIFDGEGHGLRAYYWGDYKHSELRWIRTELCNSYSWSYYHYGMYEGWVYGRTLPDLAKKELQRTGLVEMLAGTKEIDPEKYLMTLERVPELERLAKAGLSTLVRECMYGRFSIDDCFRNRSHGSLKKLLGIDTQELARLRRCDGGSSFLRWLQYEKATGRPLPDHVISWFCQENIRTDDLKFIGSRMSMVQIYNYVRRQMKENGMKSGEVLTTWSDYLAMAERFHMDTQDAIVYRVRKLRRRHDELAERSRGKSLAIRAGEILKKYPHVEQIYESIRDIYEYSDGDYSVVSPRCIEDVLQEGENLHHCVGSSDRYWERIERKESYVLFLRRSSDMEKAYYTLEIEPDGTVRQKRTMYDRQEADIEDARRFLKCVEASIRSGEKEQHLLSAKKGRRPKIEFKSRHNLKAVADMPLLRGKLGRFLACSFNWPDYTRIVVTDDFVPYSFGFAGYTPYGREICGGIILQGQEDIKKAYYGMHT